MTEKKTDRNNEWAKLYTDGMRLREIADRYGVSVTRVAQVISPLCQMRSCHDNKNKKATPENVAAWVKLYNSGKSSPQIAKEFQVSYRTVLIAIAPLCQIRKGGRVTPILRNEKIVTACETMSQTAVAHKFGISQTGVSKICLKCKRANEKEEKPNDR